MDRTVTLWLDDDDDEEDACPACHGKGTDRHGFDCTTCFGTGEKPDE